MSNQPAQARAAAPPAATPPAAGTVATAPITAPAQTTSIRPAPAAVAGRPAYPSLPTASQPRPGVRTWVSGKASGTPGRMRLFGGLAALAAIVFAVVGAWNFWSSGQALGRAAATTEQVVRVQAIYADVLRADANATNAFLVGGLEDPTQRADYEAAMKRAAQTLTAAASAQPADGAALAAVNTALQDYSALVEQARAYNRQGLPVGIAYQTQASDGLRADAEPILQALLQANTQRARDEFGAAGTVLPMWIVGLATVLVLVLVSIWLARRTHRYLNVGLSAAVAAVIVGLVAGLVVLGSIGSDVRKVADNDFAGTLALTTARTVAFDARANESLGLIDRGRAGARREPAWKADDAKMAAQLAALAAVGWRSSSVPLSQLSSGWTAYQAAHTKVRELDDAGSWDAAVAEATGSDKPPRTTFDAFEKGSASALGEFQTALANDARSPVTKAWWTAAGLLVAGLTAAVLAMRGIGRRVEEYR